MPINARIVDPARQVGGVADRLRAWLDRSLAPGVGGERRAVLAGVVLGADEGLSEDLKDRFRASGLYHLHLAVSGQNVAFIVAGGTRTRMDARRAALWLGELAVLGAISAYVLAVGLQPSVVRAGVSGALASSALARRETAGPPGTSCWRERPYSSPGTPTSTLERASSCRSRLWRRSSLPSRQIRLAPRKGLPGSGAGLPDRLPSRRMQPGDGADLLLQFGTVPVYSLPANLLAEPVVAPLLGLGLVTALLGRISACSGQSSSPS